MRGATRMLAVVVAVAGGCGGDSDDSAERARTNANAADSSQRGRTSATATDYRRKLNRLCREDRLQAERLAAGLTSPEELVPYFRKALAFERKRRPLYEALNPPPDLRDDHARSIKLGRQTEDHFAAVIRRMERGDPVEEFQKAAPRLAELIDDSNRLARRIRVPQCVVEAPAPGVAPQEQTS